MKDKLLATLEEVRIFYDGRKVGDQGPLGFRRSTDLSLLWGAIRSLQEEGLFQVGKKRFLDLGCADGRVVIFMGYLCEMSVGVEIDEWTLEECGPLRGELEGLLMGQGLIRPNNNIYLFHGDALSMDTYRRIKTATGLDITDFDIFYTYLVMHEEFARFISEKAKVGAHFWVYGVSGILPKYAHLRLVTKDGPAGGILAVYEKVY